MITILVTGCAGFIGFHLGQRLLQSGHRVLGVDNLNPFYDEGLKQARLEILRGHSGFRFVRLDIGSHEAIEELFAREDFGPVIHLAAQAGVRYSLENPQVYVHSNVAGFVNLVEAARKKKTPHFIYASSSSVYGANQKTPFSEADRVDQPISLYAATKRSDELIAHVYAHLYGLPVTGLRLFTVYGPWGRPDMALFKFCKAIYAGSPIEVYNQGKMLRDYTYVDDVVEGIVRLLERPPSHRGGPGPDSPPSYRLYNLGNHQPVELARVIELLEETIGRKADIRWLPMQPGDVPATYADIDRLAEDAGYRPTTSIEVGIERFVGWYREYYKLSVACASRQTRS
jgi:UDP-glucuronate 4-epimerase